MTQVYLIQGSDNDYHENTWIVGCFLNEKLANEFCVKLNKLNAYNYKIACDYYYKFEDALHPISQQIEDEWLQQNYNPPEELKEVVPYLTKDISIVLLTDRDNCWRVVSAPLLKHVLA